MPGEENKADKFVKDLFANIDINIVRDKLEIAKASTIEAVKKFREQGFDREEIFALLIGAMRMTPQYNAGLYDFLVLQINRALDSVFDGGDKVG